MLKSTGTQPLRATARSKAAAAGQNRGHFKCDRNHARAVTVRIVAAYWSWSLVAQVQWKRNICLESHTFIAQGRLLNKRKEQTNYVPTGICAKDEMLVIKVIRSKSNIPCVGFSVSICRLSLHGSAPPKRCKSFKAQNYGGQKSVPLQLCKLTCSSSRSAKSARSSGCTTRASQHEL
jgi:hypothetical protein